MHRVQELEHSQHIYLDATEPLRVAQDLGIWNEKCDKKLEALIAESRR